MEYVVILPLVLLVLFVIVGTLVSLSAKHRAGPLRPPDDGRPRPRLDEHD